jgi:hypothetical protein
MDPRVAAILKWALLGVIALFGFTQISKYRKTSSRKESLAAEMRTLVSEASFYRAVGEEDARATFLRGIAVLNDAKSLGLEPGDFFDLVFKAEEKEKDGGLAEFEDYPSREKLARETMTRGYQHATQLGLLAGPDEIEKLKEGKLPDVSPKAQIIRVIDPAVSPGLEKVVPNLELRRADAAEAPPTDVEIAAARNLAADLYGAQIIDREAEQRITLHFRPKDEKEKP